jgi:hypothetical protein
MKRTWNYVRRKGAAAVLGLVGSLVVSPLVGTVVPAGANVGQLGGTPSGDQQQGGQQQGKQGNQQQGGQKQGGQQQGQQQSGQQEGGQQQGDQQQGGQQRGSESTEAKRVDLGKFVSTATTPVGLIIAGAITISFFEQKRVEACARVRSLITELRGDDVSDDRRKNLVDQVETYKVRVKYIYRGSVLVTCTIILFIITNVGSSLGLIFPDFKPFEWMVLLGMMIGMVTLAGSFLSELFDMAVRRKELNTELADFDRLSREHPVTREHRRMQATQSAQSSG